MNNHLWYDIVFVWLRVVLYFNKTPQGIYSTYPKDQYINIYQSYIIIDKWTWYESIISRAIFHSSLCFEETLSDFYLEGKSGKGYWSLSKILYILDRRNQITVKYLGEKMGVRFADGCTLLTFTIYCLIRKRWIIRLLMSLRRHRHILNF